MGKLVSLSGLDGVGKSTQIKLLTSTLSSLGYSVHAGESMFTYFLLSPLVKWLRSKTGTVNTGPVPRNIRLLPKMWFVLAFVDIWASYLVKILPLVAKYDYVLADRFYTDMWANLLYYGYLPRWAFGMAKLLPQANIALLLMADPKNILKREQEFPDAYYYAQHTIYTNLGKLLSLYLIDANKAPHQVHEQILRAVKA